MLTSHLLELLRARTTPDVYQLDSNLFVASFWLMKLGVAVSMIEEARRAGRLGEHGHLVETTSGQTGYALAIAARMHGYRVTLVGDPAIDLPLRNLLEILGATVIIVEEKSPAGSYQAARLREVERVLQADPAAFWVSQYDNGANPLAYAAQRRRLSIASAGSIVWYAPWARGARCAARRVGCETPAMPLMRSRSTRTTR